MGAAERQELRYLRKVVLTTGQTSVSARHEVEPSFFGGTSVLLAAALHGGRPRIQDVAPESVLVVRASGHCLLATASRVESDGQLAPLVTVGVAPAPKRHADALWRRMHRISDELATRADQAPVEPWCASRLEPGLFAYPEVSTWIGCLEQCIAWTWVRYVEEGQWPGLH